MTIPTSKPDIVSHRVWNIVQAFGGVESFVDWCDEREVDVLSTFDVTDDEWAALGAPFERKAKREVPFTAWELRIAARVARGEAELVEMELRPLLVVGQDIDADVLAKMSESIVLRAKAAMWESYAAIVRTSV